MKKSVFTALSTSILLFGAVYSASATPADAYGVGVTSCGTYLSNRSQDISTETLYFSWAQGYLTRLNVFEAKAQGRATVNLLPSGFGISEQINWMNAYCTTHTSSLYGDAAYELYLTIRGLNGYTS